MTTIEEGRIRWTDQGTYAPGTLLSGQYEVLRLLGSGASGTVYQCSDHSLGGLSVAVKICPMSVARNKAAASRIATEILASHRVDHPNVVRFYGCIRDEGHIGLVMEYVDGIPLDALLERGHKLTVSQCLDVLVQSARGLKAIHDCGIIHRDLKPSNIMVTKDNQIKITDFGIARTSLREFQENTENERAVGQMPNRVGKVTLDGELVGTPDYISPEYVRDGVVDVRSDIYALGVIAYELLSGSCPFSEKSLIELLTSKVELDAPPLLSTPERELSPALTECVRRALCREPAQRYQRVAEFLSVLEAIRSTTKSTGLLLEIKQEERSVVEEEQPQEPLSRRRKIIIVASAITLVISLSFLLWEHYGTKSVPPAIKPKTPPHRVVAVTGDADESADSLQSLMGMSTKVVTEPQQEATSASPRASVPSNSTQQSTATLNNLPHAKASSSPTIPVAQGYISFSKTALPPDTQPLTGRSEYAHRLRFLVGELLNVQDGRLLSNLSELQNDRSYPLFARTIIKLVSSDRTLPREVVIALLKALTDTIEGDGIENLRRWSDSRASQALLSIVVLSDDRFTVRQGFDALVSRDDLPPAVARLAARIRARGAVDELSPLLGFFIAVSDAAPEEYRKSVKALEKAGDDMELWSPIIEDGAPPAITSILLQVPSIPSHAALLLAKRRDKAIRLLLGKRIEVASQLPEGLVSQLFQEESDQEIRSLYSKRIN